MKQISQIITLVTFILLATGPTNAADVLYKKSVVLYVMHDVDTGKRDSVQLDRPVGMYATDSGAVLYLKGTTLHLIRDTRNPQPEILDQSVGDFKIRDGLIAYIKGTSLYVRKLSDNPRVASRAVPNAQACSGFDVANDKVIFIKGQHSLYYVTDLQSGASQQLAAAAGEVEIMK